MDLILVLTELPQGRPFGMDSQTFYQIILNAINICVLASFMAIMLYRPIRNILHKRNDKIRGQIAQAEETSAMAAELRLQYEQKMKDIASERDEILSEARKNAAETSRRLVADAKKEADALRERAVANVEIEWERAESEMRNAIIEISAVMAEKFVTLAINKETHDRLFAETMSGLEGMSWRD